MQPDRRHPAGRVRRAGLLLVLCALERDCVRPVSIIWTGESRRKQGLLRQAASQVRTAVKQKEKKSEKNIKRLLTEA